MTSSLSQTEGRTRTDRAAKVTEQVRLADLVRLVPRASKEATGPAASAKQAKAIYTRKLVTTARPARPIKSRA